VDARESCRKALVDRLGDGLVEAVGGGRGSARWIRRWAVSTSTPVGSPRSSLRIRPPVGSGVARSSPAAASAAEFAHVAWPSMRVSATGWCGAAQSSETLVGHCRSVQRF